MRDENKLLDINPIERHAWIWIRGGLRIEPLPLEDEMIRDTGITVAKLTGRLTSETSCGFRKLLSSDPASHVMLEMSGLDYLDSAGVGALVSVYISRTRCGKSLSLANLTRQAAVALQIAGLTDVLPVYPELGPAVRPNGSAENQKVLSFRTPRRNDLNPRSVVA